MKRSKPDQKRHRRSRDPGRWRCFGGRPDPVTLAKLEERLRRAGPDAPWEEVATLVLPVLARAHQPVGPGVRLVRVRLPPGLWVGFGIDLGPAFTHIDVDHLGRWAIDERTLISTALANVERRVETDELEVASLVVDNVPLLAVQASGWGSALLLTPETLTRIVGPGAHLVFAPVRNTILALPLDAPPDLVTVLWTAIAEDEPTELDGDLYHLEAGRIVAINDNRPGAGASLMVAAMGRPN
jgi:hypothetical protein